MTEQKPDFKVIFESIPGLYLILNAELQIVAVSDQYCKATLTERTKILGRHLFEVFPDNPNDPNASGVKNLHDSLRRVLSLRLPDTMAIQKYDVERPASEGGGFEEKHWAPINTPILDKNQQIQYIIHRVEDVTERVKLRLQSLQHSKIESDLRDQVSQTEKLRQAQRMEAMGQLAGGVAHDFNNILATMMLNCDVRLDEANISSDMRTTFSNIKRNCERGAALVRQLLAFSRMQVLQTKVFNLNTVVSDLSNMLKSLITERVSLSSHLSENLSNIRADIGQVEQILLNMIVNARDAMPNGGKIVIETSNVILETTLTSGEMKIEPGHYVQLSIRDTGIGMDAATQARIFEPFFTTKEVGKGTGLGLATVYGIVKKANGAIKVLSEPNQGTHFKIYFPVAEEQVDAATQENKSSLKQALGGETILVVEDQEELRTLICSTLKSKGYQIFDAPNGEEGLILARQLQGKIDLVISDVVMPLMGGPQLIDAISRQFKTEIKVLYLSGYAEDVVSSKGVNAPPADFLEKPFSFNALITKVRAILNKP